MKLNNFCLHSGHHGACCPPLWSSVIEKLLLFFRLVWLLFAYVLFNESLWGLNSFMCSFLLTPFQLWCHRKALIVKVHLESLCWHHSVSQCDLANLPSRFMNKCCHWGSSSFEIGGPGQTLLFFRQLCRLRWSRRVISYLADINDLSVLVTTFILKQIFYCSYRSRPASLPKV